MRLQDHEKNHSNQLNRATRSQAAREGFLIIMRERENPCIARPPFPLIYDARNTT